MATTISTTPADAIPVAVPAPVPQLPPTNDGRARFSRDAYYRVFESGALDPARRSELIDGEIVMMSPIGSEQGDIIADLAEFFTKKIDEQLQCRVQLPIVISTHSEPQPDLVIVRRKHGGYRREHPEPSDIVLLIEVAKSSLSFDLGEKLRLYARAKIQEYWVVDVDHEMIIVHREPAEDSFRQVQVIDRNQTLMSPAIPQCVLELTSLFG